MDQRFTVTLPPGLVRNDSPYAVKGRYVNANKIRFWEGKPQKWGGHGKFNPQNFTEPVRAQHSWVAYDGRTATALLETNRCWVMIEGRYHDITPAGLPLGLVDRATADTGYGDLRYGDGPYGGGWTASPGQSGYPRVWTLDNWGEDLVFAPRGGQMYFWDYVVPTPKTGAVTAASATLVLDSTAGLTVGMHINFPFGTGVTLGRTIQSITNGTDLVMTGGVAGVTTSGLAMTFTAPAVTIDSLTADVKCPTECLGLIVTDDRHLVIFGAVQNGTYDPLNIAWCNREDFTVWTPSAVNTAGSIRCERGTQIMTMVKIFGGWLTLTDVSVHPFTFVGGDDIFGLDRVGSVAGCIGPLAAVGVDGVAYWMGPNNFFSYNGRVSALPCEIQKPIYDTLNRDNAFKIVASTIRQYGEVIWFVPTTTAENDSYVTVSTFNGHWNHGGLLSSTAEDPQAAYGRTSWQDAGPINDRPLGTSADGDGLFLMKQESGTDANGMPMSYILKSGELEMKDSNGTIQSSDQWIRIKKAVPDYEHISGSHEMVIDARGYPNQIATRKGPYTIDGKMFNPKARGRAFSYTMRGTGDFRMGDWEVYACPDGGRGGGRS